MVIWRTESFLHVLSSQNMLNNIWKSFRSKAKQSKKVPWTQRLKCSRPVHYKYGPLRHFKRNWTILIWTCLQTLYNKSHVVEQLFTLEGDAAFYQKVTSAFNKLRARSYFVVVISMNLLSSLEQTKLWSFLFLQLVSIFGSAWNGKSVLKVLCFCVFDCFIMNALDMIRFRSGECSTSGL